VCSNEGGTCGVNVASVVAFGANHEFNYIWTRHPLACTDARYNNDPAPNAAKQCDSLTIPAPSATSTTWQQCAGEGGFCSFQGKLTVAYGEPGQYYFHFATLGGGTQCDNTVFGDPSPGNVKACYLLPPPPSFTSWTSCAQQNDVCSFTGTHEVAFGANGAYHFGTFTGGVSCSVAEFGEPLPGTVKACYVQ
jgi:hypothetical protein